MSLDFAHPFGPTFLPGRALNGPIIFFDDFVGGFLESNDWVVTDTGTGNTAFAVQVSQHGGVIRGLTAATGNNYLSAQLDGESFKLDGGRELYFEARIQMASVTDPDMVLGISDTSTDPHGTVPNDIIAFYMSGDADIEYVVDKNGDNSGAKVDTGSDLVAATWTTLAFYVRANGKVEFFVDGAKVATDAGTNLPDDIEMSPIFTIESSGTAEDLLIDYILVVNSRPA